MNKVGKSHEILNKGFFNSEQILSKERTRTNQVFIHKRDFSSFIQRVWKWHVSPFHSPSSKKYYFSMHMKCTFQFPVCNVMMYLLYCNFVSYSCTCPNSWRGCRLCQSREHNKSDLYHQLILCTTSRYYLVPWIKGNIILAAKFKWDIKIKIVVLDLNSKLLDILTIFVCQDFGFEPGSFPTFLLCCKLWVESVNVLENCWQELSLGAFSSLLQSTSRLGNDEENFN